MTSHIPATVPLPIEVGPEMDALHQFFFDATWTGDIARDGMGPGTPHMCATGSGKHTWLQGGRWVAGDYEQSLFLDDGSFVLQWQLHWVAGWDPATHQYRATYADCYGNAGVMNGHIDGHRLVFETAGDAAIRIRLTWDITDPWRAHWRNEICLNGVTWNLVEEYVMRPVLP